MPFPTPRRATGYFGLLMLLVVMSVGAASAATYHVDADAGDDAKPGTSADTAWKSLAKVNATTFEPGDRILFKAGTTYQGQLWPKGSGKADKPIVIGRYGEGDKPIIRGGDGDAAVVKLHNQQYWEISSLEITGVGKDGWGVAVELKDFGVGRHIRVRDMTIRDMPEAEGGIMVSVEDGSPSRWDDVLIEDNAISKVGRLGITVRGEFYGRDVWNPHTNVHIRRNEILESVGNDILVIMTDGALIEHNVCRGGGGAVNARATAGIWPWSADGTVMQFNEVSDRVNVHDGQAFDSDFNTQDTLVQYNYTHNNAGGFILICNKGKADVKGNVGNRNTVVRYNVSRHDGMNTIATERNYAKKRGELMMIAGPTINAQFYNNTFYVPGNLNIPIEFQDWGGFPNGTKFHNNIFYVADGGVLKIWKGPKVVGTVWENNCFFGNIGDNSLPANQITVDPKLVNPGGDTADSYMLKADSPMKGAGRVIENNGGRDFWGNAVSDSKPPTIGAHELATVAAAKPTIHVARVDAPGSDGDAVFTITREGGNVNTAVSVKFALTGHAKPGRDYHPVGSAVLLPANRESVTVTLRKAEHATGDLSGVVLTVRPDEAYRVAADPANTAAIDGDALPNERNTMPFDG